MRMVNELIKCPLCSSTEEININKIGLTSSGNPHYIIECKKCGHFKIDEFIVDVAKVESYIQPYILSGITRHQFEKEHIIHITKNNIKEYISNSNIPKDPFDSMDILIEYVYDKTKDLGQYININLQNDYPLIYTKDSNGLNFIIDKLLDFGFFESQGRNSYILSLKGWQRISDIKKHKDKNKQAFVAMWFNNSLDEAWLKGFYKAIDDTGFTPLRIDLEEHNEKICDKVIAEIRKSRILVADVTGHRHNVYFEAGIALGLGLDVIWTCRKGEDDKKLSNIFDTRQYNHIIWSDEDDLRKKLVSRIEATIINKEIDKYKSLAV